MRLIQIPFSHNCVKVRRALELKGLDHATLDISPMDRSAVVSSSGQPLVPVLEDGERRVADSTAILRYLEEAYPQPPLLPDGVERRAECWLLEDWADLAFMELTRRLAYWQFIGPPGLLESHWFPEARGLKRAVMGRLARRALTRRFKLSERRNARDEREAPRVARLALDRLGGRPHLFEERVTVADVALAAMAAPLAAAARPVRTDPAVAGLLAWGATVLGPEIRSLYAPPCS